MWVGVDLVSRVLSGGVSLLFLSELRLPRRMDPMMDRVALLGVFDRFDSPEDLLDSAFGGSCAGRLTMLAYQGWGS